MNNPQVSYKLRNLAKERGAEEAEFTNLANSVEEFSKTLLDPLKFDDDTRDAFGASVDVVLDKAIECKQKKVGRVKFSNYCCGCDVFWSCF